MSEDIKFEQMSMTDNIKHQSASVEHYTPKPIVELARKLMGEIELDPASCELANDQIVKAKQFYTEKTDGFSRKWYGKVFLNPPGGCVDKHGRKAKTGHSNMKRWWFKLVEEWNAGRVSEALFIGFSLEILQSSQIEIPEGLHPVGVFPFCIPSRRLKFWKESEDGILVEGAQPTHANVIVYLPPTSTLKNQTQLFNNLFQPVGTVITHFHQYIQSS